MPSKSVSGSGTVRVPTGIAGLDKLLGGGLPAGSATLVTGATGTGKTILQLQFLWNGLEKGEKALFMTLEESPEDVMADAMQFGWDLAKYEKKGQFQILAYDPFEMTGINVQLKNIITKGRYTRFAFDSSSLFGMYVKDEYKIRKGLYTLLSAIKSTGCTALVSAEVPEDSKALSRYGIEEFVVDGVILLRYISMGSSVNRTIEVRKMRRSRFTEGIRGMEITAKGIVVN